MQLLYGTYNPAKLAVMREWLSPLGVELIGLSELKNPPPQAEEAGETPLENARGKATAYRRATGLMTLAADSGLYLDGLPDELQPGEHVRQTPDKRRMDDEEMIAHYRALAASLGGRAVARYRNALCIAFPDERMMERFDDSVASEPFYLVDTPHERRTPGFPLDSLSVEIRSGKYYYDLAAERANQKNAAGKGYCRFVQEALLLL